MSFRRHHRLAMEYRVSPQRVPVDLAKRKALGALAAVACTYGSLTGADY
jgi:hypothetical protein